MVGKINSSSWVSLYLQIVSQWPLHVLFKLSSFQSNPSANIDMCHTNARILLPKSSSLLMYHPERRRRDGGIAAQYYEYTLHPHSILRCPWIFNLPKWSMNKHTQTSVFTMTVVILFFPSLTQRTTRKAALINSLIDWFFFLPLLPRFSVFLAG